ncbi:FG-GAP-like repeat-containing protein [Nonomuraea sp. NPDC052116]|uniref:FG-GAP-like repeat-containing protein n=1 Tax=Nonomuraea sp. NPDC052116 TaxID=3155665 RepID=UPI003443C88F
MRTTITRGFATMTIAVGLAACSAEAPATRLPITSAPAHAPEPAEIPSTTRSPTPTKAPLKLPETSGKCRVGCDTVKAHDYNGDGYADLAIGAPGPWWEGNPSTVSGYVIVSYGGADGLTTNRQKLLQPEQAGQPTASTKGSSFGVSSASGDFDRDGYADLAVGATPESNLSPAAVTIFFGSKEGLSSRSAVLLEPEDATFGKLLTAGDFNGDGYQDLGLVTEQSVGVVYGSSRIRQHPPRPRTVKKSSEINALAAGDVTGDGIDDLVVAFSDDDPADEGKGAVYRGSSSGLKDVAGHTFDAWGVQALSVGDVNGDGFGDVIAGNSYADAADPGGQIYVHRGSPKGLTGKGVLISQDSRGLLAGSVDGDGFGGYLAVGDINHDGYADVAVSAPAKSAGKGTAFLLYGGKNRLPDAGAQVIEPDDVLDAQHVQSFGASLQLSDFNNDGRADLALAIPTESAVAVLPGSSDGVSTTRPTFISPDQGTPPGQDIGFGRSLN